VSLELESNADERLQAGLAHCTVQRWFDAKVCFEAALALEPHHKIAWNNLGNVLDELGERDAAIAAYSQALALDSNYANAKKNLAITAYQYGTAVYEQGKLDKALWFFGLAVAHGGKAFNYDHSYLQLLLETCTHRGVAQHVSAMREQTYADPAYHPHPYPLLAASDDPSWHLLAAKRHVERLHLDAGIANVALEHHFLPKKSDATYGVQRRIRIAYLSSDWHQNPVPQQLLAALEAHDRTVFEVIGIATDTVLDESPWRKRIEAAFERFDTLGHLPDAEIADKLREMDIDIAIDLSLYMLGGRPMILQSRPARVQVAMLGYAGTSGAPWIDYSIADAVTVPPHLESCF
jgi:protein O-GlcNAc transferase